MGFETFWIVFFLFTVYALIVANLIEEAKVEKGLKKGREDFMQQLIRDNSLTSKKLGIHALRNIDERVLGSYEFSTDTGRFLILPIKDHQIRRVHPEIMLSYKSKISLPIPVYLSLPTYGKRDIKNEGKPNFFYSQIASNRPVLRDYYRMNQEIKRKMNFIHSYDDFLFRNNQMQIQLPMKENVVSIVMKYVDEVISEIVEIINIELAIRTITNNQNEISQYVKDFYEMRKEQTISIYQHSLLVNSNGADYIQHVAMHKNFSSDTCIICFQKYGSHERITQLTCCRKTGHMNHLEIWLLHKKMCPYCRKENPKLKILYLHN